MKDILNNKEFVEWLEDSISTIVNGKPSTVAIAARFEDGNVLTAYYDADVEDKAMFAHHIYSDVILGIAKENADQIIEAAYGGEVEE